MRIRSYLRLCTAVLLLCAFCVLTLFSGALYTYSVLTDEALVAELRFSELGPEHYAAQLSTDGGCRQRTFELYGDQWRVDARFLKWHGWANLLGFDAHYRLSRIEGRYSTVAAQNSRPNVAYALESEPTLDLVDVAAGMGRLNIFVDSTYGSSAFAAADPELVFHVYRTQSGLIVRSHPIPQHSGDSDPLVVEITQACGSEPGIWQRFAVWLDRSIGWVLGRRDND